MRDLATTLGYQECRLEYGEFPDGVLRSAGDELQVEITEVLTPGRKRDEEYRRLKESASPTSLSHHDSREVREAGERWVDWIVAAVKKKLKYSNRLKFDIVVYNNIDHLFELPEMTELSQQIGSLLAEVGYRDHWVWQVRSTTVDLLWPRVLRLKIPDWEERF
ncbi:hypothetical protein QIH80_15650 [Bradyrhizobium elkanii]|nr:hypothetical protein QIH80_15650 [Bradyrhizobium elkanii]